MPGVAEYREPGKDPYRVFLNENTIRKMDVTFAGRPVFIQHVDEVAKSVDEVKHEADGWVIESFFNEADGKHWVKFLTVSKAADDVIKKGFKLSNAYYMKGKLGPGQWNGVDYDHQVTDAEYEHLALVQNPRYAESVIMTPDQFKKYNEDKKSELLKIANDNGETMKLNIFKRQKVENSAELAEAVVELPKSKKQMTVEQMVNALDFDPTKPVDADMAHVVKIGEESMSIKDLVEKHTAIVNELKELQNADDEDDDKAENEDKECNADDMDDDDDDVENEDDKDDKEKKKNKKKNEVEDDKEAKDKAAKLRNAKRQAMLDAARNEANVVEVTATRVDRGRQRYGS